MIAKEVCFKNLSFMLVIIVFYVLRSVTTTWIGLRDPVLVYSHWSTFHKTCMLFTSLWPINLQRHFRKDS